MVKKTHLWLGLSPILVSALLTMILLTTLKRLPPKLPLFYSLAWGEGQLATHTQLLLIPASMALIALTNLIIAWQLHCSQSFFTKILLVSSLLTTLILTVTFLKIILIFI